MNLLNEAGDSKFVTRKWNIDNDQTNINYDAGNKIISNTEVLKSNLCDYILVRDDIITTAHNNPTPVAFKYFSPFTKCITMTDEATLDNDEDLVLVIST